MGCSYSYQNEMKEIDLGGICCGGYCKGCGKNTGGGQNSGPNININQESNKSNISDSKKVSTLKIYFFNLL